MSNGARAEAGSAGSSTPPREYETIYVLRPDVEKQAAEQIATRMSDVIGREGGKLTRVENWGRRRLAYDVARHKRAVYVYLKYLGGGGVVSEVERNLRMLEPVLKFQTVKVRDAVPVEAAVVDPADIVFEHAEAPEDEEPEMSYARSLGLEDTRGDRRRDGRYGDGDDDGRGDRGLPDDSDDTDGAIGESDEDVR